MAASGSQPQDAAFIAAVDGPPPGRTPGDRPDLRHETADLKAADSSGDSNGTIPSRLTSALRIAVSQPSNDGHAAKVLVRALWIVSEGGAHPKTNACSPVNSQLGAGHDRGRGPVDSVDDHRVCRVAGGDRRNRLLLAHAYPRGPAWAARLGCRHRPGHR